MNRLERMVWVDLETTGLDPETDVILEVAVVVTDGAFKEIEAQSWVIARAVAEEKAACHPVVLQMHTDNGLWNECEASTLLLTDVDDQAAKFIRDLGAAGGPICGSSPHFDKAFLYGEMPLVTACFNHRTFDTSTLKQAMALRGYEYEFETQGVAHRALSDIRGSLQIAGWCLGKIK